MRTSKVFCLALAIGVMLAAGACAAQVKDEPLMAKAQKGPVLLAGMPSGDVYIGGRWGFRIPASAGGFSPMRRAQLAADRLNRAFAAGHTWEDARVSQIGGLWAVTMDSRLIVTADVHSARVFRTPTGQLANRWARRTVLALGGVPRQIAQQLQPIPAVVAGALEEFVAWSVSPSKSVPLLNVATRTQIGTVSVGGPSNPLDNVRAAALFEYTEDNAIVRAFVPTTASAITDRMRMTRVVGVGLVAVPTATATQTMEGIMRGGKVARAVAKMAGRWNNLINQRLSGWNVPLRARTKVVALYSMEERNFIGAAQVVGPAHSVNQVKTVIAQTSDDMIHFRATAAVCPPMGEPTPMNDVVVSALIHLWEAM